MALCHYRAGDQGGGVRRRDPEKRLPRRHRRGLEARAQRHLLPLSLRGRAIYRRVEEREIRSRPYGGTHFPVGRRLQGFELRPSHPQGVKGGVPQRSRFVAQFLWAGKGFLFPRRRQIAFEVGFRHLLRR